MTERDIAWSWTDPDVWTANAAGSVTAAQRALIAGPPIRPPYPAWALLISLILFEGAFGVLGAGYENWFFPGDPVMSALGTMAFMMLVFGWMLLVPALIVGVPRRRERRRRRRVLASLDACRIAHAAGRITVVPGEGTRARVGPNVIPVPEGGPAMPPPGTYRLYWLESVRGGPGPLLLSAEPLDDGPGAGGEAGRGMSVAEAMGLTPADLIGNRAGLLTGRQRRRVLVWFVLHASAWVAGTLAAVVVFVVPTVQSLVALASGDGPAIENGLGTLWVTAPFCLILIVTVSCGLPESRMLAELGVLRAATPVQRLIGEVSASGALDAWKVSAGSLRFHVTADVAQVFLVPGRYALYHLADPAVLLSAEPYGSVD